MQAFLSHEAKLRACLKHLRQRITFWGHWVACKSSHRKQLFVEKEKNVVVAHEELNNLLFVRRLKLIKLWFFILVDALLAGFGGLVRELRRSALCVLSLLNVVPHLLYALQEELF